MTTELGAFSPQMTRTIQQLAADHGMELARQGAQLSLAMPSRPDRWLIANLDGQRISVTHCWVEGADELSPDLDMVFALHPEGWEPVELLHTDEVWDTYVQAAKAASVPIYDEQGERLFAHFTEYWAQQIEAQGWLAHSRPVAVAKVEQGGEPVDRIPGCQSTHFGPCYGELWQCAACDKIVCFAEGSDNHPELCDACWVKSYGGLEDDVPF